MTLLRKVVTSVGLLFAVSNTAVAQDSAHTLRGDLQAFMQRMARIESNNNPRATNRFGMLGKYQFHPLTLREIGIRTTRQEFLNNEELQDSAMVRYMRANRFELRHVIKKWSGKVHRGVLVTESGILASAHLTGTMGVLSWFYPTKYRYRTRDANGASVAMYMRRFANYDIRL